MKVAIAMQCVQTDRTIESPILGVTGGDTNLSAPINIPITVMFLRYKLTRQAVAT